MDECDSRQVFNSFNNFTIKIVVEQFKPILHESLNSRITHGSSSIFREENIQTRIKSYRHWFSQTLIRQRANTVIDASFNEDTLANEDNSLELMMPSMKDLMQKSGNSPAEDENCGNDIKMTQVFRVGAQEDDFKSPDIT